GDPSPRWTPPRGGASPLLPRHRAGSRAQCARLRTSADHDPGPQWSAARSIVGARRRGGDPLTASTALLAALRAHGAQVRLLPDGAIGVRPRTVLDPGLRDAIRQQRDQLRALLASEATATPITGVREIDAEVPVPASPCSWCHAPLVWVADWPM